VPAETEPSGRDIVVIGASAGGVEALGALVSELPGDAEIAVFVVLHIAPSGTSVLPAILQRRGRLPAAHAVNEEPLQRGRIYVAPPDHHLLVQRDAVRVHRGPKENGYRPAIDPLFRSAAHTYGRRVTGVILSGVLDDGTAGMAVIKRHGGRTLVQDPDDALYPMMPSSAIEFAEPDRILPAGELAAAIMEAAAEPVAAAPAEYTDPILAEEDFIEIDRGASDHPQDGRPSGFTCPECGGVLWETVEGGVPRFRCRTGHGFSVDSLLAQQSDSVEAGLWAALRALEERAAMTRRMASRFRSRGSRTSAQRFERQADAAVEQALVIRKALEQIAPHLVPEPSAEVT
jgi:two-component system, chemotaxis family, protein-glutamate methylesterase/glutaminase